jgi:site-specific recombinase XerD
MPNDLPISLPLSPPANSSTVSRAPLPEPSRGPRRSTGCGTLADAMAAVDSWVDLPITRRRGIASSLALVARSAGLPGNAVVLTVPVIQQHLVDRTPAALGISAGRRSNAVCDVRLALRRLDLIDDEPEALAPAWKVLLARWGSRDRAPFSRFATFATMRGIAPEAVNDAIFADFAEWVVTRALMSRPTRIAGTFRRAWNAAAKSEEGWPRVQLKLPGRASDYVISFSAFPAAFVADVEAFLTRLATNDRAAVFASDTPPVAPLPLTGGHNGRFKRHRSGPLKPSTINTRRDHIRWAASALVATGVPIDAVTSLGALFRTETTPWEVLRFFHLRGGKKPSPAGHHVGEVLSMIAALHLGLPANRLEELKRWRAPMNLTYKGLTAKNEKLVRALLEPSRYQLLMRLPFATMAAAEERLEAEPRFAVSLALRALAVQILLNLPPLRLANLIGLRLDVNLQREDPKRSRITHLWVPEDETKNAKMISVPIGATLSAMLEIWIRKFRPHAAEAGNLCLFPGLGQKSITAQGMRQAIGDITHDFVGVKMHPHLCRHFNAISFLKKNPGQYEMVRKMLNHATVETTVRHYCGVEQDEAHATFDKFNEDRQRAVKPLARSESGRGKTAPLSHRHVRGR